MYSSNKNSVNLIAIIIIIFDLSIIIIAIPVIEAVTNNSIIGILGETITIQFTVIRAVPTVSIVLWNQSAGHSQLTSAKAIENLKKWEGVIEITDELLNLVKEEETGKNNNYSLVLNTCYICTASV